MPWNPQIWKSLLKAYFQQLKTVCCNFLTFTTTFRDKSWQKLFLSQIKTREVVYYDIIIFEKWLEILKTYNFGSVRQLMIPQVWDFHSNKQKSLFKQNISISFMQNILILIENEGTNWSFRQNLKIHITEMVFSRTLSKAFLKGWFFALFKIAVENLKIWEIIPSSILGQCIWQMANCSKINFQYIGITLYHKQWKCFLVWSHVFEIIKRSFLVTGFGCLITTSIP